MKLLKPNWVTHDDLPIFSVDIHPDGKRFATGGQGGDSGRVVIWNMEPIKNAKAERDKNVPKMLCQLDNHLACVNCVRWSANGLLASGGDDKVIMIWRLSNSGGGSSMFGSKPSVENWRCIATLRCHEGDILDLAWAPHSPWLASASVDNSVIVWDATKFPAIVAILKGHTGMVKGVTWDPVGKYLATQSDDRTLRVWRTADWGDSALISEPFDECGGTTHVLRLSWSPDGQYLVSAHAMNGGGPTAQIIERDGWTQDKDFVGHRKAVTCVRFNGNILQKNQPGSSKPQQYCCVAIGSRDRSLSVWLTSLKRPLVVINELFTHSVLDLSWSPCGLRLAACSWDGTVAFVQFTEKELGQPLDPAEQCILHERLYGKPLVPGACTVMETPSLLNLKISEPETKNDKPLSNGITQTSSSSTTTAATTTTTNTTTTPVKGPINKQIETRTSDGRRRITPMFIPPSPDINSTENLDETPAAKNSPTFTSTSQTKSSIIIEKRNDVVTPNVSITTNSLESSSSNKKQGQKLKKRQLSVTKIISNSNNKKPKLCFNNSNTSGNVLPPLQPSKSMSQQSAHYAVTVINKQELSHLQVFRGTDIEPTWDLYMGYNAVGLAVSAGLIVVGLEDGSIHIFDPVKGTRPAPPLVPPSPFAKIHAVGNVVMVISCCGAVRVWEIGDNCRLTVSTSARHLVTSGCSLLSCNIHNGMPHLGFTNARAYIFNKEMGTWLLVGDSQDPIWRWSAQNAGGRPPRGPLSSLQEGLNRTAGGTKPNPNPLYNGPSVVSYLEQQLLASKALGSSQEYAHWCMALVSFLLTQEGLEKRLRVILDELMGPSHSSASKSTWDPMILGLKKHQLLDDVLKVIGGHLRWQRLYIEYYEQLSELKNDCN
ncbi:protein HIRA homolog [Aphidius gifuensis]|uniref:protein HIRA homolog n=1 Tax=Aphidius gifuensis TaxID=684658 RepID=UPI001CDD8CC2|nr:protein HIRA homolog [Aphidius gifuensis]